MKKELMLLISDHVLRVSNFTIWHKKIDIWLTWCKYLTESWNSGSLADASQRFIKMNMFGFDKRFDTVWKNDFSYKLESRYKCLSHWKQVQESIKWLTANVIVDSAFKTRTKTSAFKQWLSIQSSRFGETSTPGESTKTTSSRSKLHRSRGQKIRIFELSHNFSWHRAFANCCTFWKIQHERYQTYSSKIVQFKIYSR